MRVLFLTLFPSLGSTKVRVLEFVPHLERLGARCVVKPVYSDAFYHVQMGSGATRLVPKSVYLLAWYVFGVFRRAFQVVGAWRYDAVLIQKDTLPVTLFRLLKALNSNVVYEFDDTISAANPHLNRGILSRYMLRYRSHLFRRSCALASRVVAENSYLAGIAASYNRNVSIITAPVDTDIYLPGTKQERPEVVLGWLGSPSTTYLITALRDVFGSIGAKYPHVSLLLTGAGPVDIPGIRVTNHPWTMDAQLKDLAEYDIGLMPLDNQEFNKGRLGYKMILYMSSGVPIVASAVGLNKEVVQEGVNGLLAQSDEEWVEKLSCLIENAEQRRALGQAGRQIACARYERARLAETLFSLLQRPRPT